MRHVLPIVAALAAASSVASADSRLVTEVSADPRDGIDYIPVGNLHTERLELVGMADTVDLHSLVVRFADGRATRPLRHALIYPGQRVDVDLPPDAAGIASLELDYGRPEDRARDRTDARLQVYALGCDDESYTAPRRLGRPIRARFRLERWGAKTRRSNF